MVRLFTVTVFLGAALLFVVQPMAAKIVLPRFGGSAAVWNVCMVFFQALLLGGYAYAHALGRRGSARAQTGAHAIVLAGALLATIGLGMPAWVEQAGAASPEVRLLAALGLLVGPAFFALASGGPLLQRWFSRTGHARAADPYFLYAASNAGSFLGLLAYPALIEPTLDLSAQRGAWCAGFGAWGAMVVACGVVTARRAPHAAPLPPGAPRPGAAPPGAAAATRIPALTRARWVLLAAVPASLLVGATQHITTDVAPVPLLWVVPLSLYLLTFVLAFSGRVPRLDSLSSLTALSAAALVLMLRLGTREPVSLLVGLHLLGFALAALLCHARLAAERPAPERLTEFYLLLALGGVLGGACNALLAPLVFDSLAEYPLAIVAACLLRPGRPRAGAGGAPAWRRAIGVLAGPAAVGLVIAGAAAAVLSGDPADRFDAGPVLLVLLPLGVALAFVRRPAAYALALGVVAASGSVLPSKDDSRVLHAERTFYGVHTVLRSPRGRWHTLMHGSTTHGVQSIGTALSRLPTTYYHPTGPVGALIAALPAERPWRIGVVGLGVGTLAAYARPGDQITFFEIDPAVVRIASDPDLFTYLRDCRGGTRIVLGDGRLTLAQEPPGSFDLIVLDAFTSDAIPVHTITLEAVTLYLSRLDAGGVLAFNISNRHLDLAPVLARIAERLGLAAARCADRAISPEEAAQAKKASTWVALARSRPELQVLDLDPRWSALHAGAGDPLWTDSRSNILRVMSWR